MINLDNKIGFRGKLKMKITLDTFDILFLIVSTISIVLNIFQYKKQIQMEKNSNLPVYNGLVGIFNNIKLKTRNCYDKKELVKSIDYSNNIESLKSDYLSYITDCWTNLDSFREQIVPLLKTLYPDEEKIFKGAEFGLTDFEKKWRDLQRDKQLYNLERDSATTKALKKYSNKSKLSDSNNQIK